MTVTLFALAGTAALAQTPEPTAEPPTPSPTPAPTTLRSTAGPRLGAQVECSVSDSLEAMVNVSVPSTLVDFFSDSRAVVVEIGGVPFEGLMPPNGIISFPVPDTLEPGPRTVTLLATLITGDRFSQPCSGLVLPEPPSPTPTPSPTVTPQQEADGVADEPARIDGSEVAKTTGRDESASGPSTEAPDTGQTELLLIGIFLLLVAAALGLGRYHSNRALRAR